ncbi:MAG: isoprenyl transferase [Lachnospiraceae bacterium]|nr:isoprenyl transferase [Lachnospiraceae bacterium]
MVGKSEDTEKKIPHHVAIILDGNGRWAKKRLLPRKTGHSAGARTVEDCCEWAWDLGIKYLTVYAFSTENWTRSDDEVKYLMNLLRDYMKNCLARSRKNNMRVRVIGDKSKLDADLQESIEELERESAGFTGLNFQVAINYGGRDEIVRAVKRLMEDRLTKYRKTDSENDINICSEIDEKMLASYLDTSDIPDPDLLIRTSGEQRLSNFMLWQMAYTEFYFTDILWPDFTKKDLAAAIEYYGQRDRRFGGRKSE